MKKTLLTIFKNKTFYLVLVAVIAIFGFLQIYSVNAAVCDITSVKFSPYADTGWPSFSRELYKTQGFTITIQGNGSCSTSDSIGITLSNTRGANNDIGDLNDRQFTFTGSQNTAIFKFWAGEEGCTATPGAFDCFLQVRVKPPASPDWKWSDTISGNQGELYYECDEDATFCEGLTYPIKLNGTPSGAILGGQTISGKICAYFADDGKIACISGSESLANQSPDACSAAASPFCKPADRGCLPYDSNTCGSYVGLCAYIQNSQYVCVTDEGSSLAAASNNCDSLLQCSGKNCSPVSGQLCKQSVKYSCQNGTCQVEPSYTSSGVTLYSEPTCGNQCSNPSGNNPPSGGGQNSSPVGFDFSLPNPIAAQDIGDLISIIATWIFNLAIPIAVIMILYGGFLFLTAGAKPDNATQGKKIITYAVLGLAIVFIGRGFVYLVESILDLGTSSSNNSDYLDNP